jgi:hypothetical protein
MYLLQSLGWGQNDVLPSIHLGSSGKTLINEITKTQVGISIPGVVPVDVSVTGVDVDVASVGFVDIELYVIVELDVVSVVVLFPLFPSSPLSPLMVLFLWLYLKLLKSSSRY